MVTKYDKRQNMVSSYKYKAGNIVKLNFFPKCLKFLVDSCFLPFFRAETANFGMFLKGLVGVLSGL